MKKDWKRRKIKRTKIDNALVSPKKYWKKNTENGLQSGNIYGSDSEAVFMYTSGTYKARDYKHRFYWRRCKKVLKGINKEKWVADGGKCVTKEAAEAEYRWR